MEAERNGSRADARVSTTRGFRDLRVRHASMDLVTSIYRFTQAFPRNEEFGLTSQMGRAATLIPSNIAEGHARDHLREYLHHVSIAQESCAELETQIEIAGRLDYASGEQTEALVAEAASVERQLRALRVAFSRKLGTHSRHRGEPSDG
jgi:four helix bundle protein